jgi:ABC-type sulfate transport system substrate-binding protein
MDSRNASGSSKNPPEFLDGLERDIPTTAEDVQALRANRPKVDADWWEQLRTYTNRVGPEVLRRRRTSEGVPPFEL